MATNGTQPAKPKQWILNAFTMSTPGHLASGLWRHPRNQSANYTDIEYWTNLAKIVEEGKFHGLFIADVLGHYGVYKGPNNVDEGLAGVAQFPVTDPFINVAAMLSVTKKLSFGITASTTYENPYLLARRFATLDHLAKGRVAWNVVTSHLDSAAKNLGLPEEISHDTRYKIADEFLDATYKLWEGSWREDAVVKDAKRGVYVEAGRVRHVNHKGEHFSSAGPLNVGPSIQRTPFIFQAGASSAGKNFAVKHAECMFFLGMEIPGVKKNVDEVRKLAVEQGRDPNSIKTIASVYIVVDETDEKAQAKYEDYLQYVDLDATMTLFGGWTGTDLSKWGDDDDFAFAGPGAIQSFISSWSKTVPGSENVKWTKKRIAQELALGGPSPRIVGSAKTVADFLQSWVDGAGVDGFNLPYAVNPGDFEDIIKYLLPELRSRGVFWDDYAAATARENFLGDGKGPHVRADHPSAAYTWRAG